MLPPKSRAQGHVGMDIKNISTQTLLCLHKQVTCNYVAMVPNGRVFDSSLDRGFPYDIRVGAGQVHAALADLSS